MKDWDGFKAEKLNERSSRDGLVSCSTEKIRHLKESLTLTSYSWFNKEQVHISLLLCYDDKTVPGISNSNRQNTPTSIDIH